MFVLALLGTIGSGCAFVVSLDTCYSSIKNFGDMVVRYVGYAKKIAKK